MHNTTFPTAIECIIAIAKGFDCSRGNRQALHDLNKSLFIDNRELPMLIKSHIREPLEKYVSPEFALLVSDCTQDFLNDYMRFVSTNHLFGASREIGMQVASESFFAMKSASFLGLLCKHIHIMPDNLFISENTAFSIVSNHLKGTDPSFSKCISELSKENKDKFARWEKGLESPSLGSIALLFHDKSGMLEPVKTALVIARAIDFYTSKFEGAKRPVSVFLQNIHHAHSSQTIFNTYKEQLLVENPYISDIIPVFDYLQIATYPSRVKKLEDKEKTSALLNKISSELVPMLIGTQADYLHPWFEARFHTLCGDIEASNESYKLAFEQCLYRAGKHQQTIIQESLLVAAIQKPEPDAVFLKKLKTMAISLGYEIPYYSSNKKSRVAEGILEKWEVDMWKHNFSKYFIREGVFEKENHLTERQVGPIIYMLDDHKPDYRSPNRKIKVGDIKRQMPQINFFIEHDDSRSVKKLLDKKASINVISEVGDTPLMASLTRMSVTELFQEPSKKAKGIFEKICKLKHEPETINSRTEKFLRTALVCAVDTFDSNVVKKVINLNREGIEVDQPALVDNITALYRCLSHIGAIKRGDFEKRAKEAFKNPTPELLNAVRRMTGGSESHTLNGQNATTKTPQEAQAFKAFLEIIIKQQVERYRSLSVEKVREIAMILLEAGANPNAGHNISSPKGWLKGYTPLMFAIELDEVNLFNEMVQCGGDIARTCSTNINPSTSCVQLAKAHGSKDILKLLSI